MADEEFRQMVIDYMDKGFLENIISLVKQDDSLYSLIPVMLGNEKLRVRLGTMSLIEELIDWKPGKLSELVPAIGILLKNESPVIRGDAIQALEIIGDPKAIPMLKDLSDDANAEVREFAGEAIVRLAQVQQ